MVKKNNIINLLIVYFISHFLLWVLIPTFTNTNLPLDTIEALAWGSNLDWGFDKHPPMSAVMVELVYFIFGNNDWKKISLFLLSVSLGKNFSTPSQEMWVFYFNLSN